MKFPDLSFSREPVAWVVLANALIAAGVAFGLPVTMDQKVAVDGVIIAGSAVFLRSQVSPVASLGPVTLNGGLQTGAPLPPTSSFTATSANPPPATPGGTP